MLKRLRWLMGRNHKTLLPSSSSSSTSTTSTSAKQNQQLGTSYSDGDNPPETHHEVAVYIHRFHNLDLFQQGWYQIKISMRLEDGQSTSIGAPARVVQYEAPEQGRDDPYGVWRIDDVENSFLTQPFFIKYSRQDVYLSIMVSFFLALVADEEPLTTSVILKFELLYAPALENRSDLQNSLNLCSAAVHEFRVPPKALLGLHTYCPVHFDAFHAVLIDISVHISMLKVSYSPALKASSEVDFVHSKEIILAKALIASRDILLEDLQNIGKLIDQAIDLSSFDSTGDYIKFSSVQHSILAIADKVSLQESYKLPKVVKKTNGTTDVQNYGPLHSLSQDDLSKCFNSLGNQILLLWNTFLIFHRVNKTKILEYLHDAWAEDRKAEWSIWMVYSKAEMPQHYMGSNANQSSSLGLHGSTVTPRKFSDDPAQSATARANLHRQTVAQMKINSRALQDMHIFGDPARTPIIIVEHAINLPLHADNANLYSSHLEQKDTLYVSSGYGSRVNKYASTSNLASDDRILKIVVFVHGFQGNHLDLRLVRNQWLLVDPEIEFLMSEANEDKTDGDFREMGLRLAEEVVSFTKRKMDKASRKGVLRNIKLSFVGHSIGNIIIRAALAESIMEPYLRYLYTYLSISGPHLGYMYNSNPLFNSGQWLLKKLKGIQCIHQLTFSDDPDLQNTFLYKLCKQKTLSNFRNIIMLSSPQDGYIPYHSARIEMCPASLLDYSKRGKIFWEMLNDCLYQIQAPSCDQRTLLRCDVNFDASSLGRNLNSIIGRAAHVEFLESDTFARLIVWSFPELFR